MQSIQQLFDRTIGATSDPARKTRQPLPQPVEPRQQLQQQSYSVEFQLSELSVRQRGHHVFARELSMSLSFRETFGQDAEPLAEPKSQFYSAAPAFEPPSPQDVADRILGFVDKRLQSEAAAGASQEKLDNLLSQARQGVERGFSQAREQIEKMSMMNEDLDNDISQSFGLVNSGLDELAKKYLQSDQATAPSVEPELVNPLPAKSDQKEARRNGEDRVNESARGNASAINYRAGYEKFTGYSDQLSLDVRTKDGDLIKVYFSESGASLKSGSLEAGAYGGEDRAKAYGSATSFSGLAYQSQYSIQVQGELDEDELSALNELFTQADDLAGRFFSGNYQDAFDAALNLDLNTNELAGFSLSLTQTQVRQVSAYEQFSGKSGVGRGEGDGKGLPSQRAIEQLNNLTQQLREMHKAAELFPEPAKLASDFLKNALLLRSPEDAPEQESNTAKDPVTPFKNLVENLLNRMDS